MDTLNNMIHTLRNEEGHAAAWGGSSLIVIVLVVLLLIWIL
ncbi:MAG: hypothetical protein WD557_05115 [Dehalococcoidia bacterium]